MKYGINGIEKSRIIKNIKVVDDKFIEVKYLNGKKDIIEYNEDNLNKIKDIMMEQAKKYVEKYEIHIRNASHLAITLNVTSITMIVCALIASGIIEIVASLFMAALMAIFSKYVKNEKKYMEKYNMYLQDEFKKEHAQYQDVMNKEKSLGKKLSKNEQKKVALTDITCLDNYSLEELKEIKEKVSRYTSLVGDNIEVPVLKEEKGKQKVKK